MNHLPHPGRRRSLRWLAAAPLLASVGASRAQGYPLRPIRLIPFGAGGGPIDIIARLYGEKLQQLWGQPVVVDPKPGASGILAADAVAKAAPDGHTLMITLPLTHINVAVLNPKLPYDPVADFTPLTMVATGSPLLLTRSDAPFSTLAEFVAFAKGKPGTSYGTWGIGSGAHLYGELLKRQAGIELVHVPYRAEAMAFNDLFGGLLAASWGNSGSARVQQQAGKIKVLGVAGARRMSLFPYTPTFGEQGFTGFDVDSWIGLYGPAKLPVAVADKLVAALRDITRLPDVQARLLELGFDPLGNTPAEFMAKYRADYPRMAELIRAAGVTAQ